MRQRFDAIAVQVPTPPRPTMLVTPQKLRFGNAPSLLHAGIRVWLVRGLPCSFAQESEGASCHRTGMAISGDVAAALKDVPFLALRLYEEILQKKTR